MNNSKKFALKEKLTFIFCGHFALDKIIRFNQDSMQTIGGGVTYGSLALDTYTSDAWIGIVSNLGSINFKKEFLREFLERNINLDGISWSHSKNTNFVLNYFNHTRNLTLISKSPNLNFKNFPLNYISKNPDAILLCTLCNEIDIEYIENLVKNLKNSYIAIDLQGFIRKIDNSGQISLKYDKSFNKKISYISDLINDNLILKGSEEEMRTLSGIKDPIKSIDKLTMNDSLIITTLGEKGSLIARKGEKIIKIPAFRSNLVVDETGAGDAYMSVFMYEFLKSSKDWESIKNASYLASAASSYLVEMKGPKGFQSKEMVLKRIKNKKYI